MTKISGPVDFPRSQKLKYKGILVSNTGGSKYEKSIDCINSCRINRGEGPN